MKHVHLQECDSTQTYLIEKLSEFKKDSREILITTNNQLNGKGRNKNQWNYFNNSLAMSFTLQPHNKKQITPLEIAISIADFLKERHAIKIELKWPNDLFYTQGKCGGLIMELKEDLVVCGLGINLGKNELKIIDDKNKASFLPLDINSSELYQWIIKNRIHNEKDVCKKFEALCMHMNKKVYLKDSNREGIFRGLNFDGAAIIEIGNNTVEIYSETLIHY